MVKGFYPQSRDWSRKNFSSRSCSWSLNTEGDVGCNYWRYWSFSWTKRTICSYMWAF